MAIELTEMHKVELKRGERFAFGENWAKFLSSLTEDRIREAVVDLQQMLGLENLSGLSFLDIGSGSGLSSLAAHRLGANVFSFDYDPQSVACTRKIQAEYADGASNWKIEQGSALDFEYLKNLGSFDIVYSWGVLHHTGQMYKALENVMVNVKPDGGRLFLALYNDQGRASVWWSKIKKIYVSLPNSMKFLIVVPCFARMWFPSFFRDLFRGNPLKTWRQYYKDRGMSPMRDVVDWVGGYPFEVSKPEEIFEYYHSRGFSLDKMKTCAGGFGCNQFIFSKKIV